MLSYAMSSTRTCTSIYPDTRAKYLKIAVDQTRLSKTQQIKGKGPQAVELMALVNIKWFVNNSVSA